MPNWFFLSHARFDRDPQNDPHECISKFYNNLLAKIRLRRGPDSEGFFDGTSIQQGDHWPNALADALRTCRVLVCMYSRAYFNSEYCGKEFNVFLSRLGNYRGELPQGVRQPPLILPVLLSVPEDVRPLKPIVSDIQDVDDEYPEEYRENGLQYLMVRKNQEDNYQNFLDEFAARVIRAAERWDQLPEPDSVEDIKTVQSAWELAPLLGTTPAPLTQPLEEDSLQYADFVYVAASRQEINRIPAAAPRINYYGSRGGLDFKPYYPVPLKTVGLFAQEIATKEGFNYQPAQVNNLLQQIRDARRDNRIVIIIVDTWTLNIPTYKLLVQQYDDLDTLNSSMIIIWDNKDETTINNRTSLENTIRLTFPVKMGREGLVFNSNIGSLSELEKFLPVALQELKAKIIGANETFRTAGDGSPLPRLGGK